MRVADGHRHSARPRPAPLALAAALVLSAALVTSAATAGTARSAPGWLPTRTIAAPVPGVTASTPAVAIASDGTAHAAWYTHDGGRARVVAASLPGGGAWTTARTISDPELSSFTPQLAAAADGSVTAVWYLYNGAEGPNDPARAATRDSRGVWGPPVAVSGPGNLWSAPQITIGPEGTAVATWTQRTTSGADVYVAVRPRDGSWNAPESVSPTSGGYFDAVDPRAVVAPDGTITVAWSRWFPTTPLVSRVQVAQRSPDGSWSGVQSLAPVDASGFGPAITTAADGTPTVVWSQYEGNGSRVYASSGTPGGGWAAPVGISEVGRPETAPQITSSPDGTLTVVWLRSDGDHDRVRAVSRPPGGDWETPETLSDAGQSAQWPRVAAGSDGSVAVAWIRSDGNLTRAQAASRPAGGSWSTPSTISAPDLDVKDLRIAGGPDGTAVAVWEAFRYAPEPSSRIDSALLDAAGPRLDDLVVPTAGTAGDPLAVSVRPRDAWSALGTTRWDFGDGTTATGESAEHVYRAPGTYEVTVTASDQHGNETTASRPVSVVPADPEPEPRPAPDQRPGPLPGPAPGPGPRPEQRTPACSGRFLTLDGIDARFATGRPTVRLTGVALTSVAGQRVTVVRNGRPVASGTVRADGTITVAAPAPRSALARKRASYRLVIGTLRSATHRTTRQATIERRTTLADGRVRVAGRVASISRPTRLTLTGRPACGTTEPTAIRVRTDRRGRFTAVLPAPAADAPAVTYRIRYGRRTVTLPTTVVGR